MTKRQFNILINVGLSLLIVGLVWLIFISFTNWRLSMPESPKLQGEPTLVKQLGEVVGEQKYQSFSSRFTDIAGQPPEYSVVREDSYSRVGDTVKFIADSSQGPASYMVTVHTESAETDLSCPDPTDLQDPSWVCPLSDTGDHSHGRTQ